MSAEVLREAARVMRARAEVATPSPWSATVWGVRGLNRAPIAPFDGLQPDMQNRLHIASWHPAVALAVADWLDEAADHLEDHGVFPTDAVCPTALEGLDCSVLGQALTVARAYLGDPS